jgi:Protein of unknown function (DUF1592)/Protein of unknown function (DUF1588)/Protein of unknown function (DUF1595)/Protein of unknown function (DUF1585)
MARITQDTRFRRLLLIAISTGVIAACGGQNDKGVSDATNPGTVGSNAPTGGAPSGNPSPGVSTPTPGASTPAPGASTPAPGASTPAPGASTPAPGASSPPSGGNIPPQTSLPPLDAGSAELPLRRLSRTQYVNTMQDIVRQALPGQGDALAATVPTIASSFPADAIAMLPGQRHGGFQRLDQVVQQGHIDATYEVAAKLGQELTTPARIGVLMGACASDGNASNDAACLSDFVKRLGRVAFRRPLTAAELSFHTKLAGSTPVDPTAVSDVITLMLASPQLSYFVEHGQGTAASGRASLTAHELAARLSYHFWQAPPDKELAGLADSGKLLEASTYAAQVSRLASDAKSDSTVKEFFSQWFRLQEMEALDSRVGDKVFDAFRGSFTPNASTRQNAMDEITELTSFLTRNNGTLQSVLTDKRSFAKTPDIASLYGMAVWDGNSAPPTFAESTRSGLLSRIAFTATGSANTRPIIKGYRIRSALLCQPLPPPPAAAAMISVDPLPNLTTRQVVEQVTEQPGTSCVGCHMQINPLGFASENFDALGRSRTAQRMFDAQGKLLGELPVRTDAAPRITSGDERSAADVHQATQYILQSGEFERCFAQHYFRFTFARGEREGDREAITDVMTAARSGASLKELLTRFAMRPEFQSKVF